MKKETVERIEHQNSTESPSERLAKEKTIINHASFRLDNEQKANSVFINTNAQSKPTIGRPCDASQNCCTAYTSGLEGSQVASLTDVQSYPVVRAVAKRDPRRACLERKTVELLEHPKSGAPEEKTESGASRLTEDEKYSQARSRIFCDDVALTDSLKDIIEQSYDLLS